MTNLEIIKHLIGSNADLTDERLTVAATLVGIDATAEFDQENRCRVYGLAISEISTDRGVKRFTEGGYTIEFSDSIGSSIKELALQSGCPDLVERYVPTAAASVKPVLKNASNRW